MRVVGIIPARYASTRLPGKPLEMIGGVSLIMRVLSQVKKAKGISEVIVATDDERIYKHISEQGGKALMTSSSHETGTERCFEAYQKLENHFDFIINIQGDEPFVQPEQLEALIESFVDSTEVATMYKKIESLDELLDPNIPKLVLNELNRAIYFSRSAIPFIRETPIEKWLEKEKFYKHIGIYAYRSDILATIVKLKPSKVEMMEQLEQLRWLSNGINIQTIETNIESISVDTYADLEKARKYFVEDE